MFVVWFGHNTRVNCILFPTEVLRSVVNARINPTTLKLVLRGVEFVQQKCFPTLACTQRQLAVAHKYFHLLATQCVVSGHLPILVALLGFALLTKTRNRSTMP